MAAPIYTAQSCNVAFQLNWSLSLFWNDRCVPSAAWLEPLQAVTEPDGVRILEYREKQDRVSQFWLSTKPHISPQEIVRSVKGRLQHALKKQGSRAFRRNYWIGSVGSRDRKEVDRYVASQLARHRLADERLQQRLARFQIDRPQVRLNEPRYTSHGMFCYNLHLVLVHTERWTEVREEILARVRRTILAAAAKKKHLLSRGRILADHIHLTLGCGIGESPQDVALGYLNDLANEVYDRKASYQHGFYVGTFGEYDFGAMRRGLASG